MKQFFVRKNNTDTLNLLFSGYGQDENPFLSLESHNDLAVVYDYEDLNFDESEYLNYRSINLIAWSMGVMIAPMVLSSSVLRDRITYASAFNGTIEGINPDYGISMEMWQATTDVLSEKSVLKFYRRMCLNSEAFESYISSNVSRSVDSMRRELNFIASISQDTDKKNKVATDFCYNQALLGTKDKIFGLKCMLASFEKTGTRIITGDFAHYSFDILQSLVK